MNKWVYTRILEQLLIEAQEIVDAWPLWTSVPEFVRDALREKIFTCKQVQNPQKEVS